MTVLKGLAIAVTFLFLVILLFFLVGLVLVFFIDLKEEIKRQKEERLEDEEKRETQNVKR